MNYYIKILIINCWIIITNNCYILSQDSVTVAVQKKLPIVTAAGRLAIPILFVGYGISTIGDHGLYSSKEAQRYIQKLFSFRSSIDDYLIFAPYAELVVCHLLGVRGSNDVLNTALIIGKSEILMLAMTLGTKTLTSIERPDGSDRLSFPSGHTAQAFVAASVVHKELKSKSQWFGVGAYTAAASVGLLRMINNRHWQSDVFAGAGVGMLSSQLVYLTHRHRWGKSMSFYPVPRAGGLGVGFSMVF